MDARSRDSLVDRRRCRRVHVRPPGRLAGRRRRRAPGVGTDFDHFLVAPLTTGEWTTLRRCLANPRIVVLDQDEILTPDSIWPLQRLLSHVLITGVTVPPLALLDTPLAVFVGAVRSVHVLADLV